MSTSQSNADQIAFWNGDAGAKWVKSQERLDTMLASMTAELIAEVGDAKGARILDVGCGCGDTTLALAARGGHVTGIDISNPMIARAKERAERNGQIAAQFEISDASLHKFEPVYDWIISRFGVMFFADPDNAFDNLRRALKPNGKIAFVCWREPRENEWVSLPLSAVKPHVPPPQPMGPEDPGPFAFANLTRLRRILTYAGFDRITIRPFDTPIPLGQTLEDALAHVQDIGPIARLLAEADETQRRTAAAALNTALSNLPARCPFTLGAAVWIVTATV